MKRAKKALAILLSAMMLTTLIPMSAFAAETNETVEAPDEYVEIPDESGSFEGEEIIEESSPGETADEVIEEIPDEIETESEIAVEDGSDVAVEDSSDTTVEEAVEEGAEEAEEITGFPNGSEDAFVPEETQENDGEAVGLEAAGSEKKNAEAEDIENAVPLTKGTSDEIVLDPWNTAERWYSFVPEKDGDFYLLVSDYTETGAVTCGLDCYDEDQNSLYSYYSDSRGSNILITFNDLEAGKTYYAGIWLTLQSDDIKQALVSLTIEDPYTVTLDANGGMFYSTEEATSPILAISNFGPITFDDPVSNTEGKLLKGWEDENGTFYNTLSDYIPQRVGTLKAVWSDECIVTFNAGEHGWYNSYNYETGIEEIVSKLDGRVAEGGLIRLYDYSPFFDSSQTEIKGFEDQNGNLYDISETLIAEPGLVLTAVYYDGYSVTVTVDEEKGYIYSWNGVQQQYENLQSKSYFTIEGGTFYLYNCDVYSADEYILYGYRNTDTGEEYGRDEYLEDISSDVQLEALFKKKCSVRFYGNGGIYNDELETVDLEYPEGDKIGDHGYPIFDKEGYYQEGWSYTPDGEVISDFGDIQAEEGLEFYAKWGNYVTVTFDANGGVFEGESNTTVQREYREGESIENNPPDTPKHERNVFKGWSYSPDGVPIEDMWNVYATPDMTLYAIWAESVEITFNANEGSFGEEYGNVYIAYAAKNDRLKKYYPPTPEREDYLFEGWAKSPNASKSISLGKIKVTEPMTFYAVWKRIVKITIINGEETIEVDCAEGDYVGNYTPSFEQEGKIQVGYSLTENGEAMDNEEFWSLIAKDDTLILYVVWAEAVKITFDGNGGLFQSEANSCERKFEKGTYINDEGLPWEFDRSGYSIVGWALAPNGKAIDDGYLSNTKAEQDITYYAVWVKDVAITFDGNDGEVEYYDDEEGEYLSVPTSTENIRYGSYVYPPDARRDGYYFVGWAASKDGPVIEDFWDDEVLALEDTTYYAIWEKYLTATFLANDPAAKLEDDEGQATDTYKYERVEKGETLGRYRPVIVTAPADKVLKGWALTPDATEILSLDFEITEDKLTFYAIWEDAVKVTFDANGGVFEDGQPVNVIDYKSGDYLGKRARVPVNNKEGVHLFGWATSKTAKEADVDLDKDRVTGPATYYAVWLDSAMARFHLDPNNPERIRNAVQVKGSKMTGSTFYRPDLDWDHTFDYWSLEKFGGPRVNLADYEINKDTDFYANYKEIRTVKLHANGGHFSTEDEWQFTCQVEPGNRLKNIPSDTPTYDEPGYHFTGWYDEDDKFVTDDLLSYIPKESTWLYAHYEKDVEIIPVTSVTVTPETKTLTEKGQTLRISAEILPENATNKGLIWTSSNPDAVTVNGTGTVTAVEDGTAVITATAKDGSGVLGTATVTVKIPTYDLKVENGTLTEGGGTSGSFREGAKVSVTANTPPEGKLFDKWTVAPETVPFEDDTQNSSTAIITMPSGAVTVTAVFKDKPVEHVSVTSVTVSPATATLDQLGKTTDLTAAALPENASDKTITWSSSAPGVATVDASGTVTAVAEGTATITAAAKDGSGKSGSAVITVKLPRYKLTITGGTLKGSTNTQGEFLKDAQVPIISNTPDAGKRFAKWTMEGEAHFISGTETSEEITIRMPAGEVTLTATYEDIKVYSVTVQGDKTQLTAAGETTQLTATALPENAANREVEWSSSNPEVVTVDQSGKVTAVAEGTATITAKAKDGSGRSGSAVITVKLPRYALTITGGTIKGSTNTQGEFVKDAEVEIIANTPAAGKHFVKWTMEGEAQFNSGTETSEEITISMPARAVTLTAIYEDIKVSSVTVEGDKTKLTAIGETTQLVATALPEDAANREVEWSSSNPEVATVDQSGKVTAVAEGTATITATAKDDSGKSGSAVITVKLPRYTLTITGGTIKGSTNTQGEFLKDEQVSIISNTPDAGKHFVKWTMEGEAQFNSGTETSEEITISMPARAVTLTAIYEDIKVSSVTVEGDKTKLTAIGETTQLAATALPEDAANREVEWSSSNPKVATVDQSGKVTAVANGSTTITATAKDGNNRKGSIVITVAIPKVSPTGTPAKPTPTAKPTATPTPVPVKASDGTAVGAGASAKAAADAIKKASSDEGPSGTKYGLLQARLKKATKSSIAIRWNAVKGATQYVIYGNACGKGKGFEELGRVSGKTFTCSKLADGSKLKKSKYYKFMVMAVKGSGANETVVATSKTLHITTLGGKYNNFKSIKVTKKPSKKGLKLKKTFKIKATATKKGKKAKAHRKLAYESDNEKVVTVSKSGKIKAVGKGTANIYIYAADGTFKKIKVKVK